MSLPKKQIWILYVSYPVGYTFPWTWNKREEPTWLNNDEEEEEEDEDDILTVGKQRFSPLWLLFITRRCGNDKRHQYQCHHQTHLPFSHLFSYYILCLIKYLNESKMGLALYGLLRHFNKNILFSNFLVYFNHNNIINIL